jgi:hypothetical protein
VFPIDIASVEFDKSIEATMGGSMRNRGLTGGHLCIDLTNIEMSGEEQQNLLRAVQATVVTHLARQSAVSKVVTISMSPNNGTEDEPDRSPEPPDRTPRPDPSPKPDPSPNPSPPPRS